MPERPQFSASALLVDDPRFSLHRSGGYHPERPERLVAARAALEKAEVSWRRVEPRSATDEQLARVHDPAFVERMEKLRGTRGHIDPDTYVSPESVDIARLAAGSVTAMVDAMIDGAADRAVALVRPPGHHARPAQAMGFCLFNNVAVAAAHARARGLERVAVVDWDVHHGNGTQEIFWRDAHVLYVSTHQYPFYPGTGAADERGEGEGAGFTVNVPLSAGGGDGVYRGAFERVILPIIEAYRPELLLVSAGFDAAKRDPLAEMELSDAAFGWMGRELSRVADAGSKNGRAKVALVLEGGYDLVALESGLRRAIEGVVRGEASDVQRLVDDDDLDRAAAAAKRSWGIVA
jgi:acetoin utilization deacetylase AcuC-like enzyme